MLPPTRSGSRRTTPPDLYERGDPNFPQNQSRPWRGTRAVLFRHPSSFLDGHHAAADAGPLRGSRPSAGAWLTSISEAGGARQAAGPPVHRRSAARRRPEVTPTPRTSGSATTIGPTSAALSLRTAPPGVFRHQGVVSMAPFGTFRQQRAEHTVHGPALSDDQPCGRETPAEGDLRDGRSARRSVNLLEFT